MCVPSRTTLPLALLAALFAAVAPHKAAAQTGNPLDDCDTGNEKASSSTSIHDGGGIRRLRISWSTDKCSIDARAEGEFEFESDLSDVKSISRGGYLEIDVRQDGERRSYEVSRNGNGLERHYTVNRNAHPIDDEARRWIAAVILELERRTGFAAPARVGQLLRSGGPDAVMDEVARMTSDRVQRLYLTAMMDSAKLAEPQVRRALTLSGEELSSDHEHANFLTDLGRRGYVTTAVAGDFVKSTGAIDSDHERRRALGAVLSLEGLPAATVGELLKAASMFKSDHERAELLIATVEANGFPNGPARDAYLGAAGGIGSDHQKQRVLARLTKAELSDDELVALLSTAKSIGSDHQLASLLVQVSTGRTLNGRPRDAYLAATETIESDHHRRRALTALLGARAGKM
jgi:hypothetical protein